MNIEQKLTATVIAALNNLYGQEVAEKMVQLQKTKKEFEGHLTLVVFPFLKMSKKGPEQTAQEIGEYLKQNAPELVSNYNAVKGFLNLTIASDCWIELLNSIHADAEYGITKADENSPLVMIEYSSPNTNKPLHLGHVRNNLLGWALANVMAANGNKVVKTNIVNDRGIHICKSMLAWLKYGNGETPESSGKKGDHLIGDYYVAFDKHYKAEVKELMAQYQAEGLNEEEAKAKCAVGGNNRERRMVIIKPDITYVGQDDDRKPTVALEEAKYEDSDLYFYAQALNDAGVETDDEEELSNLGLSSNNAIGRYASMMNGKIYAGVEYSFLNNMMSVGLVSKTSYNYNHWDEEITIGYNLRPCSWFGLSASYSLISSKSSAIGLGVNLRIPPFSFYVVSDYSPVHYSADGIPYKVSAANVQAGLVLTFGCMKKKAKKAEEELPVIAEDVLPEPTQTEETEQTQVEQQEQTQVEPVQVEPAQVEEQ